MDDEARAELEVINRDLQAALILLGGITARLEAFSNRHRPKPEPQRNPREETFDDGPVWVDEEAVRTFGDD